MKRLKHGLKHVFMFMLFCAALLTTFQGISGVSSKTIGTYITGAIDSDVEERSYVTYAFKPIESAVSFLHNITNRNVPVSTTIDTAASLEDQFDWSQYPKTEVVATGYTAGYESTGKDPDHPQFGITYSGVKVTRDLYSTVAADLTVFPIGTILFIPGYGFGVVADKGGAIKGNKVDLYYETVDEVYEEWGKKTVEVFVIEKGDGTLTEEKLRALNEDESMQVFRQQFIQSKRQ